MPIEELRVIAVSSIDEARLSALMPLVANRVEYRRQRPARGLVAGSLLAATGDDSRIAAATSRRGDRTWRGQRQHAGRDPVERRRHRRQRRTLVVPQWRQRPGVGPFAVPPGQDGVERALAAATGSDGALMLPWLDVEMTPPSTSPACGILVRPALGRAHMRGLIEGQMMAMANHASAVVRHT